MKTRLVRYPGGDAFQVRDERGRIGTAVRVGPLWFWSFETGRADRIYNDRRSGLYYTARDAARAMARVVERARRNVSQLRLRGIAA